MKITLLLRSGGLNKFLSYLRERLRRIVAPKAPSVQPEALPTPQANVPAAELDKEVSHPPTARNERTLVIGVDFGTSSTKVIWQDLSDNHVEVFLWQTTKKDLGSLLLPSTVTLRSGSIYFGISESDVREGDAWLHSIKLCVLCRRKPSAVVKTQRPEKA